MPELSAYNPIGLPFIELQTIDSTNNYARKLIHENLAEHGMAIFAYDQVAGKGQRGKDWATAKGCNIILSIVVNARLLQLSRQFQFSACISVAVHNFFEKYAGNDVKIKWPNDLYYQDKKAGGILIENIVTSQQAAVNTRQSTPGNWQWSIVGIGININQTTFPSSLLNPVSLKQITGKNADIIALAKELCGIINNYFKQLVTEGFENIYSEYLTYLYKKNEIVKLKKDNRVFDAMIKAVSPMGQLIIQHGIEEEIEFGEVEWIIEKVT